MSCNHCEISLVENNNLNNIINVLLSTIKTLSKLIHQSSDCTVKNALHKSINPQFYLSDKLSFDLLCTPPNNRNVISEFQELVSILRPENIDPKNHATKSNCGDKGEINNSVDLFSDSINKSVELSGQ